MIQAMKALKIRWRVFAVAWLLLTALPVWSQPPPDKSVEQWLSAIRESISVNIEKTGQLLTQFEPQQLAMSQIQRESYILLKAAYLGLTGRNTQRVALVKKALPDVSSANIEVKFLYQLSDGYINLGDYEAALLIMNKGVRLLPKLTDTNAKVSMLQGAISLLVSLNAFDEARGYATRLYKLGIENKNDNYICQGLTNKIDIQFSRGQGEVARNALTEALSVCDGSDYKIMSNIMLTLNAVDLVDAGQYQLGIEKALVTLAALQQENRKSDLVSRLQDALSRAYMATGNTPLALDYANRAYQHALEHDTTETLKSASKTLAKIKRAQGDLQSALAFYDIHLREKESAEQARLAKNLAYQRVKYDNLDKTNQLELLKFKHNSLSLTQKLQQRNNENLVLVVSLSGVLLVFMSILLVLSLKKKQSLLYNQSQEPENAGVQGIEYHGEQALHDARQKGCNFAVICFELDFLIGFDSLQADSASHALVNEVSNICQNQIRISDQFGRISDDRFIICLLDTTEQGALVLAERCREAIVALTNKNAEVSTPIKTTFGIAMIDDHQADFNEVTAAADKALLLAKNSDSEEIFIYCEEEAGN